MQKIRIHIGGTVVVQVPEGLRLDTDEMDDAINDAFAGIDSEVLRDRIAQEFRILGFAGEEAKADA